MVSRSASTVGDIVRKSTVAQHLSANEALQSRTAEQHLLRWSKQMQLISTWLPVPDEILVAEIDKACKYQGASSDYQSADYQQQPVAHFMTPFHCPLQFALMLLWTDVNRKCRPRAGADLHEIFFEHDVQHSYNCSEHLLSCLADGSALWFASCQSTPATAEAGCE